jgi:hypothetical protein
MTLISKQSYEQERDAHPHLFISSCCDISAATWLASHVRLVEIEPDSNLNSNVRLLAHVLLREQESKELPDWLWNSHLVPSTHDVLSEWVKYALGDVEEGARSDPERANHQLKAALETLDFSGCTEIFCVSSDARKVLSVGAHQYGPTYMFIWRDLSRFRFLEIHNES